MAEHNRSAARNTRIGIRRVACDLFVTHGDEINRAFGQCGQHGDVCVAAQAKDMLDLAPLQEINNMFCDGFAVHFGTVHYAISCP